MDNQKNRCLTVGIPRGLLYHRFETLWKTYFEELGIKSVRLPIGKSWRAGQRLLSTRPV